MSSQSDHPPSTSNVPSGHSLTQVSPFNISELDQVSHVEVDVLHVKQGDSQSSHTLEINIWVDEQSATQVDPDRYGKLLEVSHDSQVEADVQVEQGDVQVWQSEESS